MPLTRRYRLLAAGLAVCFTLSWLTTNVSAFGLNEADYSMQNIDFAGGSAAACSATSPSSSLGQASSSDIVAAAAEGANEHRGLYEEVAKAKDVPWQLLAAIHYRETTYRVVNPSNGQGIFQFYSDSVNGKTYPPGPVSPEGFRDQLNNLADKLKAQYSFGYPALKNIPLKYENTDPRKVKDVAFSYNGRATVYIQQAANLGFTGGEEGYEGSPYVMNFFDEKRDPRTAAPNTWGQIKSDGGSLSYPATDQVGVFKLYVALGGGTANSSSCGTSGSGGTVIEVAERELAIGTKGCRTSTNGQCAAYTDNTPEEWCADFVSWVYNKAGKPFSDGLSGGWRINNVFSLDDYLSTKHKGNYFLRNDSSQTPEPGDIIIFNDGGPRTHTGLVRSVQGNSLTTIEGNLNDSVSSRTVENYRTNPLIHAFGGVN